MSVSQLIFRNLKKNLKNYYLYVFALIFSSALYFAFVTLQYDPSMDPAEGTVKGEASIKAASVLLIVIVSVFLLYANNLFIKRRSKEIGLFQLIGMTKSRIFRLLSTENFLLYFGSVAVGILIGFAFSKLIIMILFKVTGVNAIADLHFSTMALLQTLAVFSFIYLFIMLINFIFIKRQTILSLFQTLSKTEGKAKQVSLWQMLIGIAGISLIITGYYLSTILFESEFNVNQLFISMLIILGSVIIGTYLFYKGSVNFIFHFIRKRKNGYLSINEVLSLSSIMFRMKSNAMLLTIITTVSALAIGLLSLVYISYYSVDKMAKADFPNDFSLTNDEEADTFKDTLTANGITYSEINVDVIYARINLADILESNSDILDLDSKNMPISIISDTDVDNIELKADEVLFTGNSNMLSFIQLKNTGQIEIHGNQKTISGLSYIGLKDQSIISRHFVNSGLPVAVVDETLYEQIKNEMQPLENQESYSRYIGIDIKDDKLLEKANELFTTLNYDSSVHGSQLQASIYQKVSMGLIMFIVGFLGLIFLITSGCILYFKQMDEGEEEKPNYRILRKLGFTQQDLLRGIAAKQLFNFGIPLIIGLLHSYFAVQSGWFLFGTELWTPMFIVMLLYTILYSIFGVLSVLHYKKVIKDAL